MMTALLLLLSGATAPKDDGLSWHWDRDTPSCALIQNTPDGAKVTIGRTPGHYDTSISLTVRSPRFRKGAYENGAITLSNGVTANSTIRVWSIENRQYEIGGSADDPAFGRALASSSSLTISHPDFGKFSASLRDLPAALNAIHSCEEGRLRDWGIDPNAYWALASRPQVIGSLIDLFSSDAYPEIALSRSVERNIIARLQVGTDGSVLSCSVPGNFAYPQFVDAVCKILKGGARFHPARDSTGQAVEAPYVVIVSFKMGGY